MAESFIQVDVRQRASIEQFNIMIDFMEMNGDLSRPQTGLQGRVRSERLWHELADLLNSAGDGVNKSSEKWKRVWSDWKTKTKKKANMIKRHIRDTGGKANRGKQLSPLEQRVIRILHGAPVTKSHDVEEAGLELPSQPQNPTVESLTVIEPVILSVVPEEPQQISTMPQYAQPCIASASTYPQPQTTPLAMSNPAHTHRTTQERSPASASIPRPRHAIRHRKPQQSPFDRAVSEFVAIEQSRLLLERERLEEHCKTEQERLRLESQRLDIERERVRVEAERVAVEEQRTRVEVECLEAIRLLNTQITQLLDRKS